MEWDDLRVFIAIARHRSLVGAARELRVDHTTVGRRLATLEDALGARLFDRAPEGYVPSALGARVLARAHDVEEAALAIEREVHGQDQALEGSVRVTAVDSLVAAYLLPRVHRLRERHPGISLSVVADLRPFNLSRREADVAVRHGKGKQPNLVSRKLANIGSAVYAARSYLARRGMPSRHDALTGHDLVGGDERIPNIPEDAWLGKVTGSQDRALRVNSPLMMGAAARAGLGVAVLECYLGDTSPELVRLAPDVVFTDPLYVLVHEDMAGSARVRAVVDWLVEVTREDRGLLAGR